MDKEQQASFRPAALMGGGHVQTIAGVLFGHRKGRLRGNHLQSVQHNVVLGDDDTIVLHEDAESTTDVSASNVLLVHGLGGSSLSTYMLRISEKLVRRGYRVFRMDQRNSGRAFGLSSRPYHAGRSEDIEAALHRIRDLYPSTRRALVGFSLAGNMTLKFLGERQSEASAFVDCAISVNPPIDLERCVRALKKGAGRFYDKYFLKILRSQVLASDRLAPTARERFASREPQGILDFDNIFTAPVSGFRDATDYYEMCSGRRFVDGICVPTLIMASENDPLIPIESFPDFAGQQAISFLRSRSGGHLGYYGRRSSSDRWWMDLRVVDWIEQHTATS